MVAGLVAPSLGCDVCAVYIGPQINFSWRDHLSAQAGVDLPVSIDNTALQIVPDWRVRAALTCHF